MKTKVLAGLCSAALSLTTVTPALADRTPDPAATAADAILARPLGLATTVAGSAIFLVSLPIAATSRSIGSTAHSLVLKPAAFTFTRPLGDFSYGDNGWSMDVTGDSKAKHRATKGELAKKSRSLAKPVSGADQNPSR